MLFLGGHVTNQVMALSIMIRLTHLFLVLNSHVLAQTHGEVFPTELGKFFKASHQDAMV